MPRPRGSGVSVSGAGLALAVWIAEQAGVELPTALLYLLGVVAVAMIVGGLVVAFRDGKQESTQPKRVGYVGREGSTGDLSRATFSDKLDQAIDNSGDVDASEAKFGKDPST